MVSHPLPAASLHASSKLTPSICAPSESAGKPRKAGGNGGWLRKWCGFRMGWILCTLSRGEANIFVSAEVYCQSPFHILSSIHQYFISKAKRSHLETNPNIFAFHLSMKGRGSIQRNLMPRHKRQSQTIHFLSRDKKKNSLAEPICFFPYLIIWFWRLVISKSKIFNIVNSVLQNIFLI